MLQMIWSEKALLRRQRTNCGHSKRKSIHIEEQQVQWHLECSWNSQKVRCDEVRKRVRENRKDVRSEESGWGGADDIGLIDTERTLAFINMM